MNAGRFKDLETQTNDLELDEVKWASLGAGRPMGSAAPEVGPLALLFCVLVVSVLCRIFARCIPPPPTHLFLCLYKISRQNMAQIKRELYRMESGELKLYYIEMKRALIT